MMHLLKNQRGFTLTEMLVAMVIGMLVASGAYSVFFSTTRTARKQEQVSEIQQNLRVAMERITQDIRQAGFGLPEDNRTLAFDGGSFSTPVTATNSSSAPDEITLLGVGYKVGTIYNTVGKKIYINPDFNGDDQIAGYMETRFIDGNHEDAPFPETVSLKPLYRDKFPAGGTPEPPLFTSRKHLSIGGVEYLAASDYSTVSLDGGSSNAIMVTPDTHNEYANNLPVYMLQAITYSIRADCYPTDPKQNFPCLVTKDFSKLRGADRQVVAEGIEDIQFAYGVDVSPRDGKIDYPAAGYTPAAFVNDPADDSSIVAVRVSIVARSKVPDQYDSSTRPALEDRPAGTADRYVRRTLTKTIKLRNPRSGA
ncbi:MAG: PilW family protein [Desulfuromonadaceae bacterium]|nr:PilW family protein [Desulfuromonadaceae bacterium]